MDSQIFNLNYKKDADLLEVVLRQPTECVAEEIEEGGFVRRETETQAINSIEFFAFSQRAGETARVLNELCVVLPAGIVLHAD